MPCKLRTGTILTDEWGHPLLTPEASYRSACLAARLLAYMIGAHVVSIEILVLSSGWEHALVPLSAFCCRSILLPAACLGHPGTWWS